MKKIQILAGCSLLVLLLSACDPNDRCMKAIAKTDAAISAARAAEPPAQDATDNDRINQYVNVSAILTDAEHDRTAGDYDACMKKVDQASADLARLASGRKK